MKPAEDEPSVLLCFGPWLVVLGGCAWRFRFAQRQRGARRMPVWLGAASPCAVRQASPCACRAGSGSLFGPVGRGCRWGSAPGRLAQGLCPAQQAASKIILGISFKRRQVQREWRNFCFFTTWAGSDICSQAAGQNLGSGTQFPAGVLLSVGVSPRGGMGETTGLHLPPLLNWLHDLGEFSYPYCILLIFWRCMLFLHFDISEIRVHFTNIIP